MFSRFTSFIRDYFGFSNQETRGFMVLLFLTVLCLFISFIYQFVASRKSVAPVASDQRKLDSLVALMQAEAAKQPRFADRSDKEKTTAERFSEPKLFNFDPNTVSVAGWQQLGLPKWMAERIEKYRSKGGQFRRKEDLLKIYDFPPDLYDQLEPYITLKESAQPNRFTNDRQKTTQSYANEFSDTKSAFPERKPYSDRPAKPVLQPFDINTADTAQLIALKGIGATLATRILKYRDALGGFISTDQFHDVYGLDSVVINELQTFGKIRSAARKIQVNTATVEELDRHPFLSRRQAQIIVSYREQHGAYTSVESMKPIRILDAKTIEKMAPYLEF